MTQIVDKPIRVPDIDGHHANLLDIFHASYLDQCSTEILPPLGTSDYSVIHVKTDAKPKIPTMSHFIGQSMVEWFSLQILHCGRSSLSILKK